MAIDFSGLTGAVFDFGCFERLRGRTTASDGINLCILQWAAVMVLLAVFAAPSLQILMQFAPSAAWSVIKEFVLSALLGLAVTLVIFLLSAGLSSAITATIGGGRGDFARTVGLLGYVNAGFTIVLMIPLALLLVALAMTGPSGAFMAMALITPLLLGIAIWSWLSSAKAVSVATGTSWAAGIGGTLLAGLVMAVILLAFGAAVSAVWHVSAFPGLM